MNTPYPMTGNRMSFLTVGALSALALLLVACGEQTGDQQQGATPSATEESSDNATTTQ